MLSIYAGAKGMRSAEGGCNNRGVCMVATGSVYLLYVLLGLYSQYLTSKVPGGVFAQSQTGSPPTTEQMKASRVSNLANSVCCCGFLPCLFWLMTVALSPDLFLKCSAKDPFVAKAAYWFSISYWIWLGVFIVGLCALSCCFFGIMIAMVSNALPGNQRAGAFNGHGFEGVRA